MVDKLFIDLQRAGPEAYGRRRVRSFAARTDMNFLAAENCGYPPSRIGRGGGKAFGCWTLAGIKIYIGKFMVDWLLVEKFLSKNTRVGLVRVFDDQYMTSPSRRLS